MTYDLRENMAVKVMIPPFVNISLVDGVPEVELEDSRMDELQEYVAELDRLAFGTPRDYDGFRQFLRKKRDVLGFAAKVAECMVDEDLDYILDRVKEERVESAADMLMDDFLY